MAQGIGIRYSPSGIRALGIKSDGDSYSVTAVAAGVAESGLLRFLEESGFDMDDTLVTVGLVPGAFLSVSVPRESGLSDEAFRDHLRWEVERKMPTGTEDYHSDTVVVDAVGFAFAGKHSMTKMASEAFDIPVVVDVEPVALYNGGQVAGETGSGSVMLVSIEAEGISSVVVQDDQIRSIEAVAVELPVGDVLSGDEPDPAAEDAVVEAVWQSIQRLTSRGKDKTRPIPERLVLSGGGVYVGAVADRVESKADIKAVLSEPFANIDTSAVHNPLTDKESAFTACFGLALRALEE